MVVYKVAIEDRTIMGEQISSSAERKADKIMLDQLRCRQGSVDGRLDPDSTSMRRNESGASETPGTS